MNFRTCIGWTEMEQGDGKDSFGCSKNKELLLYPPLIVLCYIGLWTLEFGQGLDLLAGSDLVVMFTDIPYMYCVQYISERELLRAGSNFCACFVDGWYAMSC